MCVMMIEQKRYNGDPLCTIISECDGVAKVWVCLTKELAISYFPEKGKVDPTEREREDSSFNITRTSVFTVAAIAAIAQSTAVSNIGPLGSACCPI